jgi:hypothetical protein
MNEQARDDETRTLKLGLELELDRQPITGCLHTEGGEDVRFEGWLGFVDALTRLSPDRSSPS